MKEYDSWGRPKGYVYDDIQEGDLITKETAIPDPENPGKTKYITLYGIWKDNQGIFEDGKYIVRAKQYCKLQKPKKYTFMNFLRRFFYSFTKKVLRCNVNK